MTDSAATLPKQYGFVIDNRRCIGCHACTVACKSEHDVPIGVNRTWVRYIEKGEFPDVRRHFSVMRCNHCSDAPCITICPTGALFKRKDGIVDFDTSVCVACKACTQACPYDALYIDPNTTTAQKCNFCAHRVEQNLLPSCVVVCPTTAIVAGDLNDPLSKIAQLVREQQTTVRLPEKGTGPNVHYIDGRPESLLPNVAQSAQGWMWSSQAAGVGFKAGQEHQPLPGLQALPDTTAKPVDAAARQVYDAPQKGILWGRKITSYIITKALSAGISGLTSLAALTGAAVAHPGWTFGIALVMLIITFGLLIWDLGQPKRFWMLLTRGNRKSWLVRGAYVLSVFGGTTTALWLDAAGLFDLGNAARPLHLLNILASAFAASYTAFLFAQAKARDAWREPWWLAHFALHGALCGMAFFSFWGDAAAAAFSPLLLGALTISLLLLLGHGHLGYRSAESRTAHRLMHTGDQAWIFWLGVVGIGHVLPLLVITFNTSLNPFVGLMILAGQILHADQMVIQPQKLAIA